MGFIRLSIAAFFSIGFLLFEFSGLDVLGFSAESHNDRSHVEAGISPVLLVWSVVSLPVIWLLIRRPVRSEDAGVPSWKRRFAAFLIDFIIIFCAIGPLMTLVPLGLEAARTGAFAWSFQRDFAVAGDWIATPVVLGMMGLVLLYFALPLVRGTQTVGCFLLRLRVIPVEASPKPKLSQAIWRVFLGYIGLCAGFFLIFSDRPRDGSTWYDRRTQFRVRLVDY